MANETAARIAELEEREREATKDFEAAREKLYGARAALAEAQGDAFQAKWLRAISEHDYVTADRCYLEDQARKILAGAKEPYGDVSEATKTRIWAEVQRLAKARGEED